MTSQEAIYNLIVSQSSPDNQRRIQAETSFDELVRHDPSAAFDSLVHLGLNTSLEIAIRQASLLHLKRLVPKHWSPAFPSFIAGDCVSQAVKSSVRQALLQLITAEDSKIRNGASYAIIQISAVDYPDEWPTILDDLYNLVNSHDFYKMLGGLTVLQDLFDDLVTDEQFFEGQVGKTIILNCSKLVVHRDIPMELRTETLKLFEVCLQQLSSQVDLSHDKKAFVKACVNDSLDLLISLLNELVSQEDTYSYISPQAFKFQIYRCLNTISNNFNHLFTRKLSPNIAQINQLSIRDLSLLNNIKSVQDGSFFKDFQTFIKLQVTQFDVSKFISTLFSEILQFLNSTSPVSSFKDQPNLLNTLSETLIHISVLPETLKDEWSSDFNSFVTQESGLSIEIHTRDAISDYLIDLTGDYQSLFNSCYEKFNQIFANTDPATDDLKEAVLYVLGSLFQNEEKFQFSSSPVTFLTQLLEILNTHRANEFIVTRLLLILPRFFTRFETQIDSQSFGLKTLEQVLQFQETELTKSAILFSFTYFNYFLRSKTMNLSIQGNIISVINDLKDDSDEDANVIFLESLSTAICIDNHNLAKDTSCLELIFEICFKEASNLGLVDSGRECLADLFQELSEEEFMVQCNKGLPLLLNTVEESLAASESVQFSASLDLALEFLSTFIKDDRELTREIFEYVFPSLTKLIISTEDDQLLQISNEVLNTLLDHQVSAQYISQHQQGPEILLRIVSKYLSPDLSDQAIANVGGLITKLIQNFANDANISQYWDQILQTVTKRLISAKEFPTIENLILIFANLATVSPQQTLAFLSNFELETGDKAIHHVIPIWLHTFETVRGYSKILLNIRALIEIFLLQDTVLDTIMVNSDKLIQDDSLKDKIITRSMRKNLKYEKIPASLKIIKLFVNEVKFHLSQPDTSLVQSAVKLMGGSALQQQQQPQAEEDDDWEDVNEYEEFADYDNDEDEDEDDAADDRGSSTDNEEELALLKNFFKKIGNESYFQKFFETLDQDERRLLAEFVNN